MQLKDIYQNKNSKPVNLTTIPSLGKRKPESHFTTLSELFGQADTITEICMPLAKLVSTTLKVITRFFFFFDDQFKDSLDAILMENTSIYHRYLQPGTFERTVLDEIIHNFRKYIYQSQYNKEMKQNLLTLLESNSYKSIRRILRFILYHETTTKSQPHCNGQ